MKIEFFAFFLITKNCWFNFWDWCG